MKGKHVVITIGREFGSGGRAVGQQLAERLGIDYYDKELLALAAKEFGFGQEVFERADEKHSTFEGVLYWLNETFTSALNTENYMSNDSIFKMQSEVILRLAQRNSCVIVGRCSDYILRNNEHCLSVFLHAPLADRIKRVAMRMGVSQQEACELIEMEDKNRAEYYNFYSSKTWGKASSYDLCLNVSMLGENGVVRVIESLVREKYL